MQVASPHPATLPPCHFVTPSLPLLYEGQEEPLRGLGFAWILLAVEGEGGEQFAAFFAAAAATRDERGIDGIDANGKRPGFGGYTDANLLVGQHFAMLPTAIVTGQRVVGHADSLAHATRRTIAGVEQAGVAGTQHPIGEGAQRLVGVVGVAKGQGVAEDANVRFIPPMVVL